MKDRSTEKSPHFCIVQKSCVFGINIFTKCLKSLMNIIWINNLHTNWQNVLQIFWKSFCCQCMPMKQAICDMNFKNCLFQEGCGSKPISGHSWSTIRTDKTNDIHIQVHISRNSLKQVQTHPVILLWSSVVHN